MKALEESKSSVLIHQSRGQECQNKLEDELASQEDLQKKLESVCPLWSEWGDCSKNCNGIKSRIDECSMNDNEIEPCNGKCPSGKHVGSRVLEN